MLNKRQQQQATSTARDFKAVASSLRRSLRSSPLASALRLNCCWHRQLTLPCHSEKGSACLLRH